MINMGTLLLIVSALLFTIRKGISDILYDYKTEPPLMNALAYLSGFICPVIAYSIAIPPLHWLLAIVLNIGIIWLFSGSLLRAYLIRFASGKGLIYDGFQVFVAAWITFILGLILH